MSIEIVGSHLKSQAAYGETSDATPSSIRKGETIKRSAFAKSVIAENSVSANAGDWQTRPVSSEMAVSAHAGMSKRGVASGSPGGAVPRSLDYGKK